MLLENRGFRLSSLHDGDPDLALSEKASALPPRGLVGSGRGGGKGGEGWEKEGGILFQVMEGFYDRGSP